MANPLNSSRELTPGKRRWLLFRASARSLGIATIMVALYYLLPLDKIGDLRSGTLLAAGLVGLALVIALEVRMILNAKYPAVQAVEAFAIITPAFLLLFSVTYYLLSRSNPLDFTEHLSRTSSLYFTITTISTVGYGDITPRTDPTRIVVMVQMLSDILILGFGVKVVLGAVQMGRKRQLETGTGDPAPAVLPPAGADQL
jgi:voltage-gated potassium channel